MAAQSLENQTESAIVSYPGTIHQRTSENPWRDPEPTPTEWNHFLDQDPTASSADITRRIARQIQRVPLDLVAMDESFIVDAASQGFARRFRVFKRTVDLGSVIVVGAISLPLLPIIAVAIKLDSPGPVVYRQMRLGKDNTPFSICKFRTMTRDAEAGGAVYAAQNDPRVTRLGRFLRRTRIDEIPQIWNVLKGDMSLIGPRPERPENLAILEAAIPCFSARTSIRPGLTGWAQVSSVNYAATTEETSRKVEYDFYYLAFGSPLLDLRIIARTFATVLDLRGR